MILCYLCNLWFYDLIAVWHYKKSEKIFERYQVYYKHFYLKMGILEALGNLLKAMIKCFKIVNRDDILYANFTGIFLLWNIHKILKQSLSHEYKCLVMRKQCIKIAVGEWIQVLQSCPYIISVLMAKSI